MIVYLRPDFFDTGFDLRFIRVGFTGCVDDLGGFAGVIVIPVFDDPAKYLCCVIFHVLAVSVFQGTRISINQRVLQ